MSVLFKKPKKCAKREIGHEYVTSSPVFNLHAISAPFLHNKPSSLSHTTNFPNFSLFEGYWVFFLVEGNGPLSSVYKALQVIDFYLSFILPCHPIFGVDVSVKASRFSVLLESHVAESGVFLLLPLSFHLRLRRPVGGVDAGGCEHQTEPLDCPRDGRNGRGHLHHHGRKPTRPIEIFATT